MGRAAAVGQVASVPGPSPCLVERTRQLIPNHLKTTLGVLTSLWERWCRRCSFCPTARSVLPQPPLVWVDAVVG